ncbi:MAG: fumarylacetoacetate hydrolase family protein [Planctomycetota bacterium]
MTIDLAGAPFHVGRVFCIGCNYAEHIAEMGDGDDDRCVIFTKPASALVPPGRAVRLPRERGAVHHEVELVVAIGQAGSEVDRATARGLIAGIGLGCDLTLRDLQTQLKARGHPWDLAKGFDDAAPIGPLHPLTDEHDLAAIELSCWVDDTRRQHGTTADMLFPVERLIAILSRTWRLLPGDLIFTGTPPGVGPVRPGERLRLASPQLGEHTWDLT